MARAPVYRYLDAKNALFGLSLGEVLALLAVAWPAMIGLPPLGALGVVAGVYVGLRLLGRGRADGFLQHWVAWQARHLSTGGYLSPAARARVPQFPFAPHSYRDLPRRGAQ
jgi:hypothetical protein